MTNKNFAYDQEELSGYYGAPDKIVVSADQMALSDSKRITVPMGPP